MCPLNSTICMKCITDYKPDANGTCKRICEDTSKCLECPADSKICTKCTTDYKPDAIGICKKIC